ncbi:MAG: hypothetical protein ACD_52C00157G0001 [uncultured bacterium]|nr:MAG: hypothetical protein ACD_52C00157G0001 [uncultured bacterium]
MPNQTKQGDRKALRQANVLESLKDIGHSSVNSFKKDLLGGIPGDFMNQILGTGYGKKYSGEIIPGESLEFSEVISGQRESNEKLAGQLRVEHTLVEEERVFIEKKGKELEMQLYVIKQEVEALASTTEGLAKELQVAAMQSPVEPGVYHLVFFEKLIEFLKSFRKKIEKAAVWLHATNKRAQKKNFWGLYKSQGTKFFLSGEHYSQRSAG